MDDHYETTGKLLTPLVTMHTTGDHISMYNHQILYGQKVAVNSPVPFLLKHIPIERNGHCTFTAEEILAALQELLPQIHSL